MGNAARCAARAAQHQQTFAAGTLCPLGWSWLASELESQAEASATSPFPHLFQWIFLSCFYCRGETCAPSVFSMSTLLCHGNYNDQCLINNSSLPFS